MIVRRWNMIYGLNLMTVLHDDLLAQVISRTRCTLVITVVNNIAAKIHPKNIFFKSLHNMNQKGLYSSTIIGNRKWNGSQVAKRKNFC